MEQKVIIFLYSEDKLLKIYYIYLNNNNKYLKSII